jgi:hypothetical protein
MAARRQLSLSIDVRGFARALRKEREMATGFRVTKTTGTLAGKSVPAVHVLRDEGNGNAEMVRIPCADIAEQDRIAAELAELLDELATKP